LILQPAKARRVLLTGFGSFPGVPVNATAQLVPRLAEAAAAAFPDTAITFDILPVTWHGGPQASAALIDACDPDVIVHFGVSERATGFVIETLARNGCHISIDAGGALPPLELIDPDAPAGLRATLPCETILRRLEDDGLPASLSEDAGQYLCNAVLFHSLLRVKEGVKVGFIHLPVTLGEPGAALTMEQALRGGLRILEACLLPAARH